MYEGFLPIQSSSTTRCVPIEHYMAPEELDINLRSETFVPKNENLRNLRRLTTSRTSNSFEQPLLSSNYILVSVLWTLSSFYFSDTITLLRMPYFITLAIWTSSLFPATKLLTLEIQLYGEDRIVSSTNIAGSGTFFQRAEDGLFTFHSMVGRQIES